MFKSKLLKISLAGSLILAGTSSTLALRDVPTGHWAKGDVEKVVNDYGFMKGDPNGNFGGNRGLTRYEFAKTLSRMIEYFNEEIDSDRKDLENIVSVMELFQNELRVIESKVNNVQTEVQAQNKAINDINELALTLGTEYTKLIEGETNTQEEEIMQARLAQLESSVDKLQNKGLFIDTLVKGTFNDIKKLGSATGRAFSATRRNLSKRTQRTEELGQMQEEMNQEVQQYQETLQEETNDMSDVELYYDYSGGDVEVMQEVVE